MRGPDHSLACASNSNYVFVSRAHDQLFEKVLAPTDEPAVIKLTSNGITSSVRPQDAGGTAVGAPGPVGPRVGCIKEERGGGKEICFTR